MTKKSGIIAVIFLSMILSGCASGTSDRNATDSVSEPVKAAAVKNTTTHKKKEPGKSSNISRVKISFKFRRMSTPASNQMAVWIENSKGKVVRTLYVSDFTGGRRGYTVRKDALKHWVKKADPADMSDDEMDAISSATPDTGTRSFTWNLKNDSGRKVPAGKYRIKLEGTLYWDSNVLYSATVNTNSTKPGDLKVTKKRSRPAEAQNTDMIKNVKVSVS